MGHDTTVILMNRLIRHDHLRSLTGWVLFTIGMIGVFLLVTFPYDHLQARIMAGLSQRTGLLIGAKRWELIWPTGIKWHEVALQRPGFPIVEAEAVEVDISLRSLLHGQPALDGRAWLAPEVDGQGGRIKGTLSLTSWSLNAPAHLVGTIERLDVARWFSPELKRGQMRVEFEHRWKALSSGTEFLHGQGEWQVALTELVFEEARLGEVAVPRVSLSNVEGRLLCKEGTCRIENLRAEGQVGTLAGEGILVLRLPLQESVLTVSSVLTVGQGNRQQVPSLGALPLTSGMPFKMHVSGPLSRLQVSF